MIVLRRLWSLSDLADDEERFEVDSCNSGTTVLALTSSSFFAVMLLSSVRLLRCFFLARFVFFSRGVAAEVGSFCRFAQVWEVNAPATFSLLALVDGIEQRGTRPFEPGVQLGGNIRTSFETVRLRCDRVRSRARN